ncbi:MAG: hypothetical protein ACREL4_09725 [Gemmatimonadales bacterium]
MTTHCASTVVLTFAAALGLAACGSKSTGPSFSSTITDGAAAAVGIGAASAFSSGLAQVFNFEGPALGFSKEVNPQAITLFDQRWLDLGGTSPRYPIQRQAVAPALQLSIASGCNGGQAVTSSGDSSDADGDGIPANYTRTFACDTVESGTTVHLAGSEHIQDDPGLYGFTLTTTLVEDVHDTAGNGLHLDTQGSETAAFTTTSAQDHLNLTANTSVTTSGQTTVNDVHQQWDATYTPTSTLLALGSPLPDGHIAFTGGFYETDPNDPSVDFNFTIRTSPPLSYREACRSDDPPYDGGEIKGFLNGRADVGFTATYTACNTQPTIVGTGNAT